MENDNAYLGTEQESKLLWKFALPCVMSLVIQSLYNLVDQIFIGHCATLGASGNAATGIVYPITVIALGIGLWLGDGTAAYLSISQGRGDTKNSAKSVGTALAVGAVASLVMMTVCLSFKNEILSLIGAGGEILAKSSEYSNYIFGGLFFFITASIINPVIRADGNPRYAMLAMAIGAVLNIGLDPLLIYAFDMGMTGAALATFIGQTVTFILHFAYLFRTKTFRLTIRDLLPSGILILSVLKYGISSFLTQFAIVIISVINNVLLVKYSAASGYDVQITQGVLTLAFKVFGIVISIIVGIAAGGQPILGYNFGAGNYERVRRTMRYILISTAIVGAVATILFEACPDLFIYVFGDGGDGVDHEAYRLFTELTFRIYLGFIFFTCILKVIAIFFQAVGQPVKATLISFCRDVIFLVPATIIFCKIGGIDLLLWSAPVTDTLTVVLALVLYAVFLQKFCRKKEVPPDIELLSANQTSSDSTPIDVRDSACEARSKPD